MCYLCWEKAGKPSIINEKTIAASWLIDKIDGFAGNAHIVVDDWNVKDHHIQSCLKWVEENEDDASEEQLKAEKECLEYLLKLTEDERYSAMAINDRYIDIK